MLRLFAILLGIGFIFAGVAGNMPMFLKEGLLFGYFNVDNVHNLSHLIIGVIAIMAATRHSLTKLFFKLLGLFYTVIGIYGFWSGGDLFITWTNLNGNIMHITLGIISILLGFSKSTKHD
jgi:hypothetical protein